MPRCFSISIQSEVAWRALLRAFTEPAMLDGAAVEQELLGQRRLARVRVRDDRERAARCDIADEIGGKCGRVHGGFPAGTLGRNGRKQKPPAGGGGRLCKRIIAGGVQFGRSRSIHCAKACMNFVMKARVSSFASLPSSSNSFAAPAM